MPMTTVMATDRSAHDKVQVLRKRITYAVPGTTVAMTVGRLPPGAAVIGGGAMVITAFNGAGAKTISIGVTGTANAYANALDVSTIGFKTVTLTSLAAGYSDSSELTVTATFTDTGSTATAGIADIHLYYVTKAVT